MGGAGTKIGGVYRELRPHVQELNWWCQIRTRTHCVWQLVMSHAAGTSSVGHVPKKKRLMEPKSLGYSIGVIGSGNIARALVEGVLASGKGLLLHEIGLYCTILRNVVMIV